MLTRALLLLGIRDDRLAAKAKAMALAGRILPAYLASVQLTPGQFRIPANMARYFSPPQTGVDVDGMFAFRAAHAPLLKAANWRLDDRIAIEAMFGRQDAWPLPYIDGKRPYGDSSCYQLDMASLLSEPSESGTDQHPVTDEDQDARMQALHYEMTAALQVFLTHARPA